MNERILYGQMFNRFYVEVNTMVELKIVSSTDVTVLRPTFLEVLHLEHGRRPEGVGAAEPVHVALLLIAAVAVGRASPLAAL